MGDTRREQLAALPFAEKLKIREKLRARTLAIAAAGLREPRSATEEDPSAVRDEKPDDSK